MAFGYFQQEGRVYTLKQAFTPRPWVNPLYNDTYFILAEQFGSGRSIGRNRDSYTMLTDQARYIYLKDKETGDTWNAGGFPVKTTLDDFTCEYGQGYIIIKSRLRDIEVQWRLFVPKEGPVEIWDIAVQNLGKEKRHVSVYPYMDISMVGPGSNWSNDSQIGTSYQKENHRILYNHPAGRRYLAYIQGFMVAGEAPVAYETVRKLFSGTYGSLQTPQALSEEILGNHIAAAEPLCGSFQFDLTLEPGQHHCLQIVAGLSNSEEEINKWCGLYLSKEKVISAFNELQTWLESWTDGFFVQTPEHDLNDLFNHWIKRQIGFGSRFGRSWALGTRDVMQDAAAYCVLDAGLTREAILHALSRQYSDGHMPISYSPVDTRYFSDSPLWILFTTEAYLRETNDFSLLEHRLPYADGEEATVLEHLVQALHHLSADCGEHGLCLMHGGDWNDALNRVGIEGRGESIWTSMAFCMALRMMIEIGKRMGDSALVELLEQDYARMRESIQRFGWNGSWFIQAYSDSGRALGDKNEAEGFLYLLPQAWSILSGVADENQWRKAMAAVDEYLECDYGSLLLYPPYTQYDEHVGRITCVAPGYTENGSVYCHGTAFKIMADLMTGRVEEAYASMKKLLPGNPLNPVAVSGQEPFTTVNTFFGPANKRQSGQTYRGWVTGTGGWLQRNLLEGFIGFKPDFDGFIIKPSLPSKWNQISLRRSYQGYHLSIDIRKVPENSLGQGSLRVNDVAVQGNRVPVSLLIKGIVNRLTVECT